MNSQKQQQIGKRGCLWWSGRIGLGIVVLVIVLLTAGAGWQFFAQKADAKNYPPPGKLVRVNGHAMHIYCTGTGSPTVILEGGVPEWSIHWQKVQPGLAKTTRVCSYDRAGYGWSEPGPAPRTAEKIVSELHTLLANAGEPAPYVLVSHSFWGPAALLYQHTFPNEIVGMVFIETWSPEMFSPVPDAIAQAVPLMRTLQVTASLGLIRLLDNIFPMNEALGTQQLPKAMQPIFRAAYTDGMWAAMAEEYNAMDESGAQTKNLGSLGSLPVTVIRAGIRPLDDYPADAEWDAALQSLAARSTNGKLVVATNSGHNVQLEQPLFVVETIQQIIRAAK